jgi:hypothetical protein
MKRIDRILAELDSEVVVLFANVGLTILAMVEVGRVSVAGVNRSIS